MKIFSGILSLLPAFALAAGMGAPANDAGARLEAAYDAYRGGDEIKLTKVVESLRGNELEPWATYWLLRLRLDVDNTEGVADFLAREDGSYLGERMRREWLKWLGNKREWGVFRSEYPRLVYPDTEIVCYSLQSRLDQRDVSALDEARPLWFGQLDLPDSCQPVMNVLVLNERLNQDDIWQRIRRLLESRRYTAATEVAAYLPAPQAPDAKLIETVADNPAKYLAHLPAKFDSRRDREMTLFAIQRMTRSDPLPTASQWRQIENRFSAADRGYVWGQLAWQAALKHLPEGLDWYALAGDAPLTEEQAAWKARAALRAGDWPRLERAIGDMSRQQAADPTWVYWLARAEAAQGLEEEAKQLYLKISGQPNFYGNLADDELGRPITVPPKPTAPTAEEMLEAETHPGLHRALALMNTEVRIEGVREWVWNLRGMNDRKLLAAADLALRNDIYDRAINTADKTLVEHDYDLRYLAPLRNQVEPRAREVGLDTAWVYGLMRQESRFVMSAHSSAGARGLMQLMPGTARWVARKIGLADYHPGRVTEPDTNVTLGTRYLRMVLDKLDNDPVLASAAYNAGPARAQRWRADRPLEAAVYAETIPFNETRDYVKKVLSNAVYYAALFENRPQSLKQRLNVIQPRTAISDAGPASLP